MEFRIMGFRVKIEKEDPSIDFTAKIERRNPGDNFGLADLKMSHQECEGGPIKVEVGHYNEVREELRLLCGRCGAGKKILFSSREENKIISMALNGGEVKSPYMGIKFYATK